MEDKTIMLVVEDHQETRRQCSELSTGDLKVFTYDELKCATMGFGYKTRLGDWSFGKVYKGWVDEMTYSPTKHGTGLAVVIKTFSLENQKSMLDLVLKKLSHPNLVKFIGYCIQGDLLFLVDEFYYGNFEDCLRYGKHQKNPDGELNLIKREEMRVRDISLMVVGAISRLPLATKVKMALGIARAIVFLQKAYQTASARSCADQWFKFERCNILLDEDFTAKLSDYNVSLFRLGSLRGLDYDIEHPAHNPPPSIFGRSNVTSFTMVLAEILTGETVSETNPLVKMNDLRHNKEILNDPKSLGSVAKVCFEICNDVDSESKTLRLLKKFDSHIPT